MSLLGNTVNFNEDLAPEILEAARLAIDETTEAAAEDARGTRMNLPAHTAAGFPWYGVTARVEDEVFSEPAEIQGEAVTGRFGASVKRGDYAFWLEREQPYLLPACDREFPELAGRIRARMEADQ